MTNTHFVDMGSYSKYKVVAPAFNRKSVPLEPGIYMLESDMFGHKIFHQTYFESDKYISIPGGIGGKIMAEINQFWSKDTKDTFARYELTYKRGILMYGKPGTGKTCVVVEAAKEFVKQGGYVLFNPNLQYVQGHIQAAREVLPDAKFLVVFEEFDNLLKSPAIEARLLSLLDGQTMIDNVVYLATTNYLEKVPARIKDRPSRFASVIEVPPPDAAQRKNYLEQKIHKADLARFDINKAVELTGGFTVDHLKDVILTVLCFNQSVEDAAAKIRTMNSISYHNVTVSTAIEDEEIDDEDSDPGA